MVAPCLLCGRPLKLTRHHVVPKMYRRHLQQHMKFQRTDIISICVECHQKYEDCAQGFKVQIWERYGGVHPSVNADAHATWLIECIGAEATAQLWRFHYQNRGKLFFPPSKMNAAPIPTRQRKAKKVPIPNGAAVVKLLSDYDRETLKRFERL